MPGMWTKADNQWQNGFGDILGNRDDLQWGVDDATEDNTGVYPNATLTPYSYSNNSNLPAGVYIDRDFSSGEYNLVTGRSYMFINCGHYSSNQPDRLVDATGYLGGSQGEPALYVDCDFWPTYPAHNDTWTAANHRAPIAIRGRNVHAIRCKFIDCNDAFSPGGAGNYSGASGMLLQQSFVDKMAYYRPDQNNRLEGGHNDCVSIDGGGTGTQLLGNTFRAFWSLTVGDGILPEYTVGTTKHGRYAQYETTKTCYGAAVYITTTGGTVTDGAIIDGNLILGGQWPLHISPSGGGAVPGGSGHIVRNNRFGNTGTPEAGHGAGGTPHHIRWSTASYAARGEESNNLQLNDSNRILVTS
jgi:hypothetical protein